MKYFKVQDDAKYFGYFAECIKYLEDGKKSNSLYFTLNDDTHVASYANYIDVYRYKPQKVDPHIIDILEAFIDNRFYKSMGLEEYLEECGLNVKR